MSGVFPSWRWSRLIRLHPCPRSGRRYDLPHPLNKLISKWEHRQWLRPSVRYSPHIRQRVRALRRGNSDVTQENFAGAAADGLYYRVRDSCFGSGADPVAMPGVPAMGISCPGRPTERLTKQSVTGSPAGEPPLGERRRTSARL
jgi:hypothetical protein